LAGIVTFLTWKWSPLIVFVILVLIFAALSFSRPNQRSVSSAGNTPASPTVQQSAVASGDSTINQAGRDVVINQGVSEQTMRELLRDKSITANSDLVRKYPLGYALLGVADGKIIYEPNFRRFRVEADWENWKIGINTVQHRVRLFMSRVHITNDRGDTQTYVNEVVEINYSDTPEGQSFDAMHAADRGVGIYFEIVDLEKWIFLIGFKHYSQ